MSKSLGNGVEPEEIIEKYGADSLRLFLLENNILGSDLIFEETKIKGKKERELELANKKLLVALGDIHLQLLRNVGKIILLQYHRKLYDEAKTKFKTIKAEDISEEVRKKAAEIFQTFVLTNKNSKEILENIDAVNKSYPEIVSDSDCSEAKEAEKEASISRPVEWLSEFAENQKMWFLGEITFTTFRGIEEMDKGADLPPNFYPSTGEELNFLQKIVDEFPKILDWGKKTYDSGEIEDIEAKIQ
ncbi:638_t:CDS:2 [Entrophospora sp. SA101]|nr:638_t:CDS:2 [Entrophospora sp. SA101]CAJ0831251.1 4579_t:CDS:2 [Entrophospora sp. SA101]